jgi:hypothetical protein
VRWIVVDDGPQPQRITVHRAGWDIVMIRPAPLWQPGDNTQARNLLAGLRACDRDTRLVIIEDDDHYAPTWLETCERELEHAELVGECRARYYNIATKTGRQLGNTTHASLCSTAMRGSALAAFRAVCQPAAKFIDVHLWRQHPSRNLFVGGGVTGIKGLPGRGGIGMGHRKEFAGTRDPDHSLLRRWIGDDAEFYA